MQYMPLDTHPTESRHFQAPPRRSTRYTLILTPDDLMMIIQRI